MFISTRNPQDRRTYRRAIFQGLAPDGGLYVPEEWQDHTDLFRGLSPDMSFQEMAGEITAAILSREIRPEQARALAKKAFFFEPQLKALDENITLLELFHGPSCAFKDFGASFLAASMEFFLEGESEPAVILTATSGDTGSAVAQAFHNRKNIEVVILYPSGRVSPLQEKQLTTLGGNIQALEIDGSFDDCQRMVKEAFLDADLQDKLHLTSANSINLGRLLPQSFYYIFARVKTGLNSGIPFRFCVPSGNFGNLTAGLYAWKWGLPVDKFIAATNRNDVVPQYLFSGEFDPRPSVATYSNAMDVGNPSNFERMLHLFNRNWKAMRSLMSGYSVTDSETLELIGDFYRRRNHFLDPHTAVGIHAVKRFLYGRAGSREMGTNVVLSTAHAAKFTETVEKATGKKPTIPPQLQKPMEKEKKALSMGADMGELKQYLIDTYR